MKILLIKPPEPGLADQTAYPPMGLLYVGAALEEAGFDVELQILESDDYTEFPVADIYGISMHGPGVFNQVKKLAAFIRELMPGALIVGGGAFPTCVPGMVLDTTDINVVVIGEGERTMVEICKRVEQSKPWGQLQGIAYLDDCIETVITDPRPAADINALPIPARHLLNRHMIRYRGGVHHSGNIPATTIIVSRGCPFNCAFCDRQTWGRKWRGRYHSNILFEIDQLITKYGITWYRFVDDNMLADRQWFEGLLDKMIELCPGISWTCLARADDVDLLLLEKMKAAGCTEIFFGCESGSQKLLDSMGKKTTVEDNVGAIGLCRVVGIKSCAYLLFGFPGEDAESVQATKDFLRIARPDKSRLSTFLPVPGSDVYANPKKYGVSIRFDPSNFWYFDDHDFCVQYSHISNEEMAALRDDLNEFYRDMGYTDGWTK